MSDLRRDFEGRGKPLQRAIAECQPSVRSCRVCGCTDEDCSQCIEKTGKACHWVEADLCSACQEATS